MDAHHNPYSAPTARVVDPSSDSTLDPRRVEMVRVGQLWVNYTFLAYLGVLLVGQALTATSPLRPLVGVGAYLVLVVGGAIGLGRIGTGMQTHMAVRVLSIVLLLVPLPFLGLLILALSSGRASRFLRKAGLKVGLLGARKP